jgi:Ni,Fe-hydrogenase I large subunit
VLHGTVNNHLDKWIPGGIQNNYLFSNELDNLNIEKLKEVHLLRKHNNLNVWVYDANTLELIGNFNSIKKAADYFNVGYRSLINHLDTKEAAAPTPSSLASERRAKKKNKKLKS